MFTFPLTTRVFPCLHRSHYDNLRVWEVVYSPSLGLTLALVHLGPTSSLLFSSISSLYAPVSGC